jgi:hypothetical protein
MAAFARESLPMLGGGCRRRATRSTASCARAAPLQLASPLSKKISGATEIGYGDPRLTLGRVGVTQGGRPVRSAKNDQKNLL